MKTVRAALAGEPIHITGPELNDHIREAMFYSRPLLPIRIEVQGDNIAEFVMHPPRDKLPLETKVYSTPPLVILLSSLSVTDFTPQAHGDSL